MIASIASLPGYSALGILHWVFCLGAGLKFVRGIDSQLLLCWCSLLPRKIFLRRKIREHVIGSPAVCCSSRDLDHSGIKGAKMLHLCPSVVKTADAIESDVVFSDA